MTSADISQVDVVAPITGSIIDITDVPDAAFASKALGDGFGIANPPGGDVVAPVTGTVMMVAKTLHAVGIRTESGLQFLVHLGIDTVELEGEPFTITVDKGDMVTAGQVIGTMNVEKIKEAGKETATIVAVTNTKKKLDHIDVTTGFAEAGTVVATASAKIAEAAPTPDTTSAVAKPTTSQRPSDLKGYDALAWEIIDKIGGKENVRSVTHCITRVRFYLHNNDIPDDAAVGDLDGVLEVIRAGGQFQVVIGPEVEDVYNAIVSQLGDIAAGDDAGETAPKPTTAIGWLKYGFSSLIGVITGSMIPIIGLLAASGIIKGVLALLTTYELVNKDSNTYILIDAMSDSVFFFMPIFVGFTAAKRLGSDPIVVAIIGGVLTYPSIIEMSKTEVSREIAGMPLNSDFFGIPFHVAS